jgi:hypothetical protein
MSGSTTRKFKCRCSKCFKKYKGKRENGTWNNVEYVSHTNASVKLRCKNCKYEWTSNSKSAFRMIP